MFDISRSVQSTGSTNNTTGAGNYKSYHHHQTVVATVWNVSHNLGRCPSVTIVDSAGTEVMGDVRHVDTNSLVITFSLAFAGDVYCN